ncbi:hypothetical protein [Nocardia huaxiensis]|uniref:Uncharacterized protein n=1 Tax=Nocardia huaxiensis TaxID=2755382 RepID=A0A7D6ZNL2_9NOCA|nr:hypothetical protein [Nocardia huaxiensis]QLY29805.1 hypothetical protein H0264_32065 [Nocardia huaxiensis]UFS96608.1 hypothetical protein LPY97_01305 [Nocardia huaxiensis]
MEAGEESAERLYQQALGGTFRMDVACARECAANFLRFADALDPQIAHVTAAATPSGFGAFPSSAQLRTGFAAKATELTTTLSTLQLSATRMAAAYLLAAGLIQHSDTTHSRALLAARAGLDSPS